MDKKILRVSHFHFNILVKVPRRLGQRSPYTNSICQVAKLHFQLGAISYEIEPILHWGWGGKKVLAMMLDVAKMWTTVMVVRSRITRTPNMNLNLHLFFLPSEDDMSFVELGKSGLPSASSGEV